MNFFLDDNLVGQLNTCELRGCLLTSPQEGAGSAVSVGLKVQWLQQGKQRHCSAAALSTKRSHPQNGPSRKEIIVIQYYYTFIHDWRILDLFLKRG